MAITSMLMEEMRGRLQLTTVTETVTIQEERRGYLKDLCPHGVEVFKKKTKNVK